MKLAISPHHGIWMQKFALGLVLVFLPGIILSQQVIHGKVTASDTQSELIGVNIFVKGTTNGTVTGPDGTYEIKVNAPEDVLVFSYIGYLNEEVQVGDKKQIDVVMVQDIASLQEIVVMGYNSKKRSEITSAVSTVSSDKLAGVTSNDIGSLLQGKVAGLQVINSSGAPGAVADVRIRGTASFSAPKGPLYVVDGIIGGNYDPNDVETVTVLKDAGATGMYGSMANGGVIVITTKKGKAEKPQFAFKFSTGFRDADHGHVRMMDSRTLYNYQREFYRDPEKFVIDDRKFKLARPDSLLNTNTDWLKETFKRASVKNYFLSASGKNGKLNYYIGGSYYDEEGTFINTNFRRVNVRANTDYHFSDKVTLTNNINISGSRSRGYDYMNIYYAYVSMPWDNPYDASGKPRSFKSATDFIWSKDKINPVYAADNSSLTSKGFSFDYDLNLNIVLTPWLSFSSTNRVYGSTSLDQSYYAKNCDNLSYFGVGYVSSQSNFNYGGISTNLLKFNVERGNHVISGLVGFEGQGSKSDFIMGAGQGMPEGLGVPSVAAGPYEIAGFPGKSVMQSIISQLNYNYFGKYFLSGSYRIDQTSQFPSSKRTASFPSLSAAWLLSNEDFIRSLDVFSNLKLKASWGITGMKDIGPELFIEKFVYASQYNGNPAAIPAQMANPNLTWEQTDQFNLGLEVGLFKRIDLGIDLYNNITSNLLVNRDLPPSGGFKSQWQNIGKDKNSGVEISLSSTNIKTSDFTWTTDFSLGFNKNELMDFGKDTIISSNAYSVSQIYHNGAPLYTWVAREFYGIDPANGSMEWVDRNGNITHDYNEARKVEYGSPMPKYQGGFATELKYKQFSLRGNFSYVYGNKIFNYFARYVDNDLQDLQFNVMMPRDDYKLWQQPGDKATKPLPQNAVNSSDPSTRFIEDGSYLKIRNLTLSYDLPTALASSMKLTGLTVSVAADNVYTFTNFWGQDPEVSIDPNNGLPGYAEFKYPNNKQYLLILNIRF